MEGKLQPGDGSVTTPYYLIDEGRLEENLKLLASVRRRAGVKILLAQKAFSCFDMYPLVARHLDGTTASGLFEARLAHEEMPERENHVFNPAFTEGEMPELVKWCDHIVFNSVAQWKRFRRFPGLPSAGLRVNHGYSEIEHDIYNPCVVGSRLGVPRKFIRAKDLDGLDGLHFHTMCEQGADVLVRTLQRFEEQFGEFLPRMKWVNFGGGHHITKPGYDVELLVRTLKAFRRRHPNLEVYLEPGEAIALNAGTLVSTVREVIDYGVPIAILDASAECHTPDVIAMPYRPPIKGAAEPGRKRYTYRLGGPTCLAGDVFGDYSFSRPLKAGSKVVMEDMAIYSMVKNNTFNGIPLPSIAVRRKSGKVELLRQFGYQDFKGRLGGK